MLTPRPLVLDLDGTVIRTDTFHEMMVSLLTHRPLMLLKLPAWFWKGRPYAKAQLVAHTNLKVDTLPYNHALLSLARQENRPLILATGTDQKLAEKIANHLGIFEKVIGSHGQINMTGQHKARALVDHFGEQGFDYAGDSPIDTWVWKVSHKVFVVAPKWGVLKQAQALKTFERIHYMPRDYGRLKAFICTLRPLFWVLNGLSGSVSLMLGLSLLSSGLLVFGDLLTLQKEREAFTDNVIARRNEVPTKQSRKLYLSGLLRPLRGLAMTIAATKSIFAEGYLHLSTAFMMAPLLVLSGFTFAYAAFERVTPLLLYSLVFIIFDHLTRTRAPVLRWGLLGLVQLGILWMCS